MVKSPDFLAVGHVTKDLLSGGGYTVGGTVTYAALTARGLGLSAAVFTSAPPDLDLSPVLQDVALHVIPSLEATTFENIYKRQVRHQFVRGVASILKASHLPPDWRGASIVLLGPLVGELGLDWLEVFPASLVGVTPQGWMRQWDDHGRVTPKAWLDAERVLAAVDVLIFSEDDVEDSSLVERYARMAKLAVVTRGQRGATVFQGDAVRDFPAFCVQEVDPTGAGDVFAAAFLIRLKETGDPYLAAPFANCAASFAVEGSGTATIPTRQQVEERLRHGKLYG